VRGLNSRVAKLQSTLGGDVRTATEPLLKGLGGDGCFPPKTASVLFFEKGQKRHWPEADRQ